MEDQEKLNFEKPFPLLVVNEDNSLSLSTEAALILSSAAYRKLSVITYITSDEVCDKGLASQPIESDETQYHPCKNEDKSTSVVDASLIEEKGINESSEMSILLIRIKSLERLLTSDQLAQRILKFALFSSSHIIFQTSSSLLHRHSKKISALDLLKALNDELKIVEADLYTIFVAPLIIWVDAIYEEWQSTRLLDEENREGYLEVILSNKQGGQSNEHNIVLKKEALVELFKKVSQIVTSFPAMKLEDLNHNSSLSDVEHISASISSEISFLTKLLGMIGLKSVDESQDSMKNILDFIAPCLQESNICLTIVEPVVGNDLEYKHKDSSTPLNQFLLTHNSSSSENTPNNITFGRSGLINSTKDKDKSSSIGKNESNASQNENQQSPEKLTEDIEHQNFSLPHDQEHSIKSILFPSRPLEIDFSRSKLSKDNPSFFFRQSLGLIDSDVNERRSVPLGLNRNSGNVFKQSLNMSHDSYLTGQENRCRDSDGKNSKSGKSSSNPSIESLFTEIKVLKSLLDRSQAESRDRAFALKQAQFELETIKLKQENFTVNFSTSFKEQIDRLTTTYELEKADLRKNYTALQKECECTKHEMAKKDEALRLLRAELEKLDNAHKTFSNKLAQADSAKSKLEETVRDLKENLTKAQTANVELKMTKQYLNDQLEFYKIQSEESRKMYERLFLNISSQRNCSKEKSSNPDLLELNKALTASVTKLQTKNNSLEDEIKLLKSFRKIVYSCSSFRCQKCTKLFDPTAILAHCDNCLGSPVLEKSNSLVRKFTNHNSEKLILREKSQGNSPGDKKQCEHPSELYNSVFSAVSARIEKTVVNSEGPRPVVQYIIKVTKDNKEWEVRRKFKEFCDLYNTLVADQPSLSLPKSCKVIQDFYNHMKTFVEKSHKLPLEDRKIALEKFLNDLAEISQVRSSSAFKEFLIIQEPPSFTNLPTGDPKPPIPQKTMHKENVLEVKDNLFKCIYDKDLELNFLSENTSYDKFNSNSTAADHQGYRPEEPRTSSQFQHLGGGHMIKRPSEGKRDSALSGIGNVFQKKFVFN